ncbi:hypothetical protein ACFSJ3_13280 [Corallincola platygyrae]|uniref:Cupin domain-containing protein n=1 Tax=Corallincola platygyrae TaxID=1193278 RepID=A0ABW4XPR3_9GAMM
MNRHINRVLSSGALLLLFMLPGLSMASAFKPAHIASPEQYQLLLENEQVLVLKMVLQPGEADTIHRHHDETVYFEKGGTLTITEGDGKSIVAEVPDGHVMWHPAWVHQVTNSGDTTVVAIIVEKKP